MPELPEVEGYKVYIDSTILHKKIIKFECRDNRLLKKSVESFEKYLLNEEFSDTVRIGKYLFIKTTGKKTLVVHFGMTGRPNYYKDEEERPKYGHIVLTFQNGFHFAYENKRKFGWWDLIDSIEDYKEEHKLSDDAGKNGQIDHLIPVQIDHLFRLKVTTQFRSKLTTQFRIKLTT